MKLELMEFTCRDCSTRFEATGLNELVYGEFIMRSKRGAKAHLNAIKDAVFAEVRDLLDRNPELSRQRSDERATLLQQVFGPAACDWDQLDMPPSPYEVGAHPPCPKCGSHAMSAWQWKNPAVFVDEDVPAVTHAEWAKLTAAAKAGRLKSLLRAR